MTYRLLDGRSQRFDASTLAWLALLVLAVAVYALGLGGQYNPSNGDELVYTHIARLTAASRHWLPLVSELDQMRNTKPPLLFWQAIVAGGGGQNWTLAALRTPSLIYTLLIAGALAWTVQQITHNLRSACVAACVYLAFFSTFRYGRTFLTSAPETFWLNVPMFVLLWQRLRSPHPNPLPAGEGVNSLGGTGCLPHPNPLTARSPDEAKRNPGMKFKYIPDSHPGYKLVQSPCAASGRLREARSDESGLRGDDTGSWSVCSSPGWLAHAGFGLAFGLGLAYKSFALIAPAAATLWCAQLLSAPQVTWRAAIQVTLKVGLSAALALAVFSLWFALDPNPTAVWQEFVIGENANKLSNDQGYWQVALLGGGGSIWAQLLAYAQNAGLLAFVVLGLGWFALKSAARSWHQGRRGIHVDSRRSAALVILLSWLVVWLIVFTLPSQRSARYVIPAMPALAMLIALYWDRIARGWFLFSLLLCAVFMVGLGRIAWAAHDLGIGNGFELGASMFALLAGLVLGLGAWFKPGWTRAGTVAACITVYACFGLSTAPLNGPAGRYPSTATGQLVRARIAVPSSFNGQFERFEFLLPGNQFVPYDGEGRFNSGDRSEQLSRLLTNHDAVVWLPSEPSEATPPCVPTCTVLATRWEVKGRHQSGEITLANVWYPQSWLFRREWLVVRSTKTNT